MAAAHAELVHRSLSAPAVVRESGRPHSDGRPHRAVGVMPNLVQSLLGRPFRAGQRRRRRRRRATQRNGRRTPIRRPLTALAEFRNGRHGCAMTHWSGVGAAERWPQGVQSGSLEPPSPREGADGRTTGEGCERALD
jgi:hypothetical protein